MASEKELRDLIRLIYECSVDPRQWQRFLADLGKAVNTSFVGLIAQDLRKRDGSIHENYGLEPYWMKLYAERYDKLNVWFENMRLIARPGCVLTGEQGIRDAELEKTEFYCDYLRPQNLFYSFGGVLTLADSVFSYIAFGRSHQAGPASKEELFAVHELIPHLQTALRLHRHIAGLDAQLAYSSAALDFLPQALAVTDAAGKILHMNRRAEALLKLNDGISIAPDGLRAGSSEQTARLRGFISRAAGAILGNGRHPGGVMQIQRAGLRPLRLQIFPLSSSSSAGVHRRPAVAIFIIEPEQDVKLDPVVLGALLDLSPSEARLTAALAAGETIQRFAKETGVSLNTARTLLKRVFSKTGVSRQAELVKLALTCAGGSGGN
jgi:DNA-binding CsgD family transcriptional regulator